jgi:two-component system phosphate regulon sensor histidine kinase PhoR
LWGLVAAAVFSLLAVQVFARPVRALTVTARAMLGDLEVRSRLRANDELGELASALDELADGLANSLANLGSERDRLGAILEAMVEGVLVTDAQGGVALANRALREMFLVEGRDILGRTPIEAMRNAELHDVLTEAARLRSAVTREISVAGLRPRTVLVRAAPVDALETTGVVAVLSDVTQLRRLETVRRDFVANVSHELRTPIAAVRAAVETLTDGGALGSPDSAREFVSIIERHANRLHTLVEDLLELSRIEAKELTLQLEPLDAHAMLVHCADLLKLAAEKKHITVRVMPAPRTLPRALADKRALEHIISNLVDNAIKYSPDRATVALSATSHDGSVLLEVRDTGAGIERRHLPRLFERFYRVDPGRSRQLGGTGLGLAIVKHLTEALGGVVTVESTVGKGTTFRVELRASATDDSTTVP